MQKPHLAPETLAQKLMFFLCCLKDSSDAPYWRFGNLPSKLLEGNGEETRHGEISRNTQLQAIIDKHKSSSSL